MLAEAAFFVVHDMAPSLVMKFDGVDSVEGILPEVLYGRVGDVAVPPPVQQSVAPPVVCVAVRSGVGVASSSLVAGGPSL